MLKLPFYFDARGRICMCMKICKAPSKSCHYSLQILHKIYSVCWPISSCKAYLQVSYINNKDTIERNTNLYFSSFIHGIQLFH